MAGILVDVLLEEAMLKPQFYRPHPLLTDYISHIMVFDAKFDGGAQAFSPFPPMPQHALHFYPRDPVQTRVNENLIITSPDSIIVGPQVNKVDVAMGKHHVIVSVAFNPGGLYRLLKIPMQELFDVPSLNAASVLGKDFREVNERLKEAATHAQMQDIVQSYLIRKIQILTLTPWERAMRMQLSQIGGLSIDAAASVACLGVRQYERKMKLLMGYSPKTFAKLIRFSKAYRLKETQPAVSWTTIAHESGYFDQMHLIRDFREFTGSAPGMLTEQIQAAPILLQQSFLKI